MSKHLLYLFTYFILAGFLISCDNSGGTNTASANSNLAKQQSITNISNSYFLQPDNQFTMDMNTVFAGQTFSLVFVVTGAINSPILVSFANAKNSPGITYNPSSCTITAAQNYCSTTVQVDLNTPPISLNPGYTIDVISSGIVLESLTFAVETPLLSVLPQPTPGHISINGQSTIGFTLHNIPTFNQSGTIPIKLYTTSDGVISVPTDCKIAYESGTIISNTCSNIPIKGIANGSTSIVASATNFKDTISHFITVGSNVNYTYVTNNISNNLSVYSSDLNGLLTPLTNLTQMSGKSPKWTTFDPSGHFAYITNSSSNTISMFKVGTNGALIPLNPQTVATGENPITITFEPTGRFAYVANQNSNNISMYKVDQTTGILIPLSTATIAAGSGPTDVTVDLNGQYVYVTNYQSNNISIYQVNQITGILSPIASTSTVNVKSTPYELKFDPTGSHAYVPNSLLGLISVFNVDKITGMLTLSSQYQTEATKINEIQFAPNGQFAYVTNQMNASVSMLRVDPNSGALSALNPTQISSGKMPIGLSFDASGQYLYVTNIGDNTISMFNFNSTSGILSPLGIVATGNYPIAITVN